MSISASSLCRLSFPCLCLFMCLCKTFILAISYDSILSSDLPSFSVFFIMELSPLFYTYSWHIFCVLETQKHLNCSWIVFWLGLKASFRSNTVEVILSFLTKTHCCSIHSLYSYSKICLLNITYCCVVLLESFLMLFILLLKERLLLYQISLL